MSANFIRIIACLTMLCDHIGYSMQVYGVGSGDAADILRIIGRLSLPLFAFMIAEGFKKTHNVFLYMLRILGAALLSEIPYNLMSSGKIRYPSSQNAMFSLLLGLITIYLVSSMSKSRSKYLKYYTFIPVFLICYLAKRLSVDYGYFVVLLILLFYLLDTSSFERRLWYFPALALFAARHLIVSFWNGGGIDSTWSLIQLFEIFCMVPILFYNGKKGYTPASKGGRFFQRLGFYLFYPAHMTALYFVFRNWEKLLSLFA